MARISAQTTSFEHGLHLVHPARHFAEQPTGCRNASRKPDHKSPRPPTPYPKPNHTNTFKCKHDALIHLFLIMSARGSHKDDDGMDDDTAADGDGAEVDADDDTPASAILRF